MNVRLDVFMKQPKGPSEGVDDRAVHGLDTVWPPVSDYLLVPPHQPVVLIRFEIDPVFAYTVLSRCRKWMMKTRGRDEPSMDWKRLVSGTLFFFILFLSVGSSSPPDDMEQLIDAFRRAGGRSETAVLHHGNRTRTPLPREEVGDLARRLSRELGLKPARRTESRHGHRWTATGKWGRNLTVRLNVINDRADLRKNRPYISVSLTGRGHPDRKWSHLRNRLEKVLAANGISPQIQFSIQGSGPMAGSNPRGGSPCSSG